MQLPVTIIIAQDISGPPVVICNPSIAPLQEIIALIQQASSLCLQKMAAQTGQGQDYEIKDTRPSDSIPTPDHLVDSSIQDVSRSQASGEDTPTDQPTS